MITMEQPSLWETARYRLKYCLKGPLNPKTTNQPTMEQARVWRPNKLVGLRIVGEAEGLKRDAFVRACGKIVYLMIIFDSVSFPLKYVERRRGRVVRAARL